MRALVIATSLAMLTTSATAAEPCHHKTPTDAYLAAQEIVRDTLKAPSTATFPSYPSDSEKLWVSHIDGCTFSVLSYVDAENAFSAMLRKTYIATVEYDAARDRWTGHIGWPP